MAVPFHDHTVCFFNHHSIAFNSDVGGMGLTVSLKAGLYRQIKLNGHRNKELWRLENKFRLVIENEHICRIPGKDSHRNCIECC